MSELNIYQRINAIMKAVKGVEKSSKNDHVGYKYAGHEALTEALRGKYVEFGIVRQASVLELKRDGANLLLKVEVSFVNIDRPEDRVSVVCWGESTKMTRENGASPVQVGVALSYAVKNAEFKLFSLTGDTTPDTEETDRGQDGVDVEALRDIIIDRYESAESVADITEARAMVEGEWRKLRQFKDQFAAVAAAAKKRVGVS